MNKAAKKEISVVKEEMTPSGLIALAVEKGADVDQLTKLMDLQERWEANEARKAYVVAMSEFRADPPEILKNKRVEYKTSSGTTVYDHASLDNASNIIGEALSKHGLSYTWKTEQLDGGQVKVTCTITHIMGHSESTSLQAGADQSGGKNNIQAIGSTVTYLERYTLFAAAGVAAQGDDDGRGAEPAALITEEQVLELHSKAVENEVLTGFMTWLKSDFKVERLEDIRADRFEIAMKRLDSAVRAKEKK